MLSPTSSSEFRSIQDSAWLPKTNSLIYIVWVNTETSTMESEKSEIWKFNLSNDKFSLLHVVSGEIYFGEPRNTFESGYWSPDGRSIIVRVGHSFSLLDIDTGKLKKLTEDGVLYGKITLP
jgi:hypothetical protein